MKYLLTIWILIQPVLWSSNAFCQHTDVDTSLKHYDRILRATINIEGEQSNGNLDVPFDRKLTQAENYALRIAFFDSLHRNAKRHFGAAILLIHKDSHYLVTCRHMLLDETSIFPNAIYQKILLVRNISDPNISNGSYFDSTTNRYTYEEPFIDRYNASQYILSDLGDDLAVIALDRRPIGQRFVKLLLRKGYSPITLADLSDDVKVGDEVFAIGFPDISYVDKNPMYSRMHYFEARGMSAALVSRGKVTALFPERNKFECDIFIYKGHSGGPIIKHGKIAGIVSIAEPGFFELNTGFQYMVQHNMMVSSRLIAPLLYKLELIPNDP